MLYVLWTVLSIVAYISGLIVITRVTPRLLARSFDEGLFMGLAAADIIGALLAFGGVVVTYALFNGALYIRVLNFFLLVGIFIVSARMSLYCLRPNAISGSFRVSRILAGSYGIFLATAALFYVVLLFSVM